MENSLKFPEKNIDAFLKHEQVNTENKNFMNVCIKAILIVEVIASKYFQVGYVYRLKSHFNK